jgi:hypothetical protein
MVNAEIYKADPNDNLFRQSRGMSPNPNEMPWPDPLKKMWFILLGQTTQKAMPQVGQPLKRRRRNGTLHSFWLSARHCSLGWRCCVIYEEGVLNWRT